MVKKHYLGKWPQNTLLTLGLRRGRELLGVIVFAQPPNQIAARFPGETWELARLWLDNKVPTNGESFTIGRALRYLRREHPTVRTVVSFADPKHGHQGIIYRASNWRAHPHPSKHLYSYTLR